MRWYVYHNSALPKRVSDIKFMKTIWQYRLVSRQKRSSSSARLQLGRLSSPNMLLSSHGEICWSRIRRIVPNFHIFIASALKILQNQNLQTATAPGGTRSWISLIGASSLDPVLSSNEADLLRYST